jgi:hypothetical protein
MKERGREKQTMTILIIQQLHKSRGVGTRSDVSGSWRHYLNYYHRLIQTASVIAGHDQSLHFIVLLSILLQ